MTILDMDPLTECQICHNTLAWHRVQPDGSLHHEFDPDRSFIEAMRAGDIGKKPDASKVEQDDPLTIALRVIRRQSDPSLRLLMVKKGLVTVDEMEDHDLMVAKGLAAGKKAFDAARPEETARAAGSGGAEDQGAGSGGAPEGGVRDSHSRSQEIRGGLGTPTRQPGSPSHNFLRDRPGGRPGFV